MHFPIKRSLSILLAFLLICGSALAYEDLLPGSKGEEVKKLQTRLAELGYYDRSIDGDYGKLSKTAVKAFQAANGLEQTGEATVEVLELLYSADAKAAPPVSVSSIKLNNKSMTLYVGETKKLTHVISPAAAQNSSVVWETSDENVALVSEAGTVTAVNAGTCTVTCTAVNGSKSASAKVTVPTKLRGGLSFVAMPKDFSVRNGICFGMHIDDVALVEEKTGLNLTERKQNGDSNYLYYEDVKAESFPDSFIMYQFDLHNDTLNQINYSFLLDDIDSYSVHQNCYSVMYNQLVNIYGKPSCTKNNGRLLHGTSLSQMLTNKYYTYLDYAQWLVKYNDCMFIVNLSIEKTSWNLFGTGTTHYYHSGVDYVLVDETNYP